MKKLVYGVGFNDRSRPTCVDGKIIKEYTLWCGILNRCFDEKCQDKHPTYKGCSVSYNFLNYSYFYDWCKNQVSFENVDEKGRSWQLDKDILSDKDKVYSENTCVFVPQEINTFFVDCAKLRGEYPIGVSVRKGYNVYKATCSIKGKHQQIGKYLDDEDAFNAYKYLKESLCKELALKWRMMIDERAFNAMMKWVVKSPVC